jgi:CheY-like chemotaxis protein
VLLQLDGAASPQRLPDRPHRRGAERLDRAAPRPQPVSAARPPRVNRRGGLVLIVDDSLHTREMYTEYLRGRGLAVVAAADAHAGLALARSLRPDVIVMDLAMPGLNGIAATQQLKRDPRTRRMPVIVLTGYAFRAIEQGALEAGADVFLTKPCLPEDLETKIRGMLPPPKA